MGRNRIPTEIQDAKGYFLDHPERFPEGSEALEDAAPLEVPPARLSEPERDIWREIAGQLVPGVLKVSDATLFEAMVRLVAKMRDGTLETGERTQLIKLGAEFGMSPSSRPNVRIQKPEKTKVQEFLTRKAC